MTHDAYIERNVSDIHIGMICVHLMDMNKTKMLLLRYHVNGHRIFDYNLQAATLLLVLFL